MDGGLREQDNQISDVRRWYESYSPEEQARIRAALEKVSILTKDLVEGMYFTVKIENDECDEAGNTLRWADCHFSVWTTLAAIRAWDAGENFTPPTVLP